VTKEELIKKKEQLVDKIVARVDDDPHDHVRYGFNKGFDAAVKLIGKNEKAYSVNGYCAKHDWQMRAACSVCDLEAEREFGSF